MITWRNQAVPDFTVGSFVFVDGLLNLVFAAEQIEFQRILDVMPNVDRVNIEKIFDDTGNPFLGGSSLDWITPESYRIFADNPAAAFQAALDSGLNVWLTNRDYHVDVDIFPRVSFQQIAGSGNIKPIGNAGLVLHGGLEGIALRGFRMTADTAGSEQHLGKAIKVSRAHRVIIDSVQLRGVYDGLYVEGANVVTMDKCWGNFQHNGIEWSGSGAELDQGDPNNASLIFRSDILNLLNSTFAALDPLSVNPGLLWNGNCNSMNALNFGLVGGAGLVIDNTTGHAQNFPAIGRFLNLQLDYPSQHGIDIRAALTSDMKFVAPYVLGAGVLGATATRDGIRVGAGINDREIAISGSGKIRGNTGYGINVIGGVVNYDGAADLQDNVLGPISSSAKVWNEQIGRLKLGAFASNFYFDVDGGGNPLIGLGVNCYIVFDLAAGVYRLYSGGVEVGEFGLHGFKSVNETVFGLNLPNPVVANAKLKAVAAGRNVIYGPVPAGRKAIFYDYFITNQAGHDISHYAEAQIAATWFPITTSSTDATATIGHIKGSGGTASGPIVLNAGESIAINSSADGGSFWGLIVEFDSSSGVNRADIHAWAVGNNVLFTMPGTGSVQFGIPGHSSGTNNPNPAEIGYVYLNSCGVTRAVTGPYVVANGDAAGVDNQFGGLNNVINGGLFAKWLSVGLAPGDALVVNNDGATAGQLAWINYRLLPPKAI